MLHTADAPWLYGVFGFHPAEETYLEGSRREVKAALRPVSRADGDLSGGYGARLAGVAEVDLVVRAVEVNHERGALGKSLLPFRRGAPSCVRSTRPHRLELDWQTLSTV